MILNRTQIVIVVSLCIIGTIAVYFAGKKQSTESTLQSTGSTLTETPFAFEPQAWALPDPAPNDAHDYKDLLVKLEAERVALASRYKQAASSSQQADVLAQARTFVTRSMYAEIFPAWYGTPWDFYG